MPSIHVDPAAFDPAAIPAETLALNKEIIARLEAEPTGLTISEVRARRLQGLGAFPQPPKSPRATTISIDGPAGPIDLRVIAADKPRGIFYHIHGGGWSIGANDQLDPVLERFADNCGIACLSVEYRLAPEHQYPAGPDDCEAAALWIVTRGTKRFGTSKLRDRRRVRRAGISPPSRCCACATGTSSRRSRPRCSTTAASISA